MPHRSGICKLPRRDTEISQRDTHKANITRSGRKIGTIARAADLQANGLSQNCHGPRLETFLFVGNTAHTHNLPTRNEPATHSTFLRAHLPTDPAHGTLNGRGVALHEGGRTQEAFRVVGSGHYKRFECFLNLWCRSNFVSLFVIQGRACEQIRIYGKALLTCHLRQSRQAKHPVKCLTCSISSYSCRGQS